ncbi:MAG TPA: protein phosphatase 2C domain-containing protein, partial [Longimicrobiales bacterium]|nr:protein phosphatase 2C domain-containing protein [Longimicrobiales bacterium]
MRWHAAGLTDRGRKRRRNEDAVLVEPSLRLFAVADGMGGHAEGHVASQLAIEALLRSFPRAPSVRIEAAALSRRLITAFDDANRSILSRAAANSRWWGMGTTLTALAPLRSAAGCVIAHVGDSRAYRLRAGALAQLTRDHTWVQNQVDHGILTPLQARHHPMSSVLSRVLGTPEVGPPDTFVVDATAGDVFLLCSDGLTNMIE